jgi:putative ABC transport system ATP-binding protein
MANILASHSLNEAALEAHVQLYRTIMFGDSPLSRPEREAIAVAVSGGAGIIELLAGLAARRGTTIVVATHNPELAVRAPRRLAMRDGQFVGQPVPV